MNDFNGKKVADLTAEDRQWIATDFPGSKLQQMIANGTVDAMINYDHIIELASLFVLTLDYEELIALRGQYDNGVAYLDHRLAGLFETMKKYDWYEDAVFVITSDHGEAFGQHVGQVGHGGLPFQEQAHVPLIFHGGGIPAGARITSPGAGVDIAPTLLDIAGLSAPDGFQGVSLLPTLQGKKVQRRPILSGSIDAQRLAFQDDRWKLVHDLEKDRVWLFDLDSSDGEQIDRSSENPDQVKRLKKVVVEMEKNNQRIGEKLVRRKVELSEDAINRLRELGYL
jgi:arylsulfatase A-like enzyme